MGQAEVKDLLLMDLIKLILYFKSCNYIFVNLSPRVDDLCLLLTGVLSVNPVLSVGSGDWSQVPRFVQ